MDKLYINRRVCNVCVSKLQQSVRESVEDGCDVNEMVPATGVGYK